MSLLSPMEIVKVSPFRRIYKEMKGIMCLVILITIFENASDILMCITLCYTFRLLCTATLITVIDRLIILKSWNVD